MSPSIIRSISQYVSDHPIQTAVILASGAGLGLAAKQIAGLTGLYYSHNQLKAARSQDESLKKLVAMNVKAAPDFNPYGQILAERLS